MKDEKHGSILGDEKYLKLYGRHILNGYEYRKEILTWLPMSFCMFFMTMTKSFITDTNSRDVDAASEITGSLNDRKWGITFKTSY